MSGRPPNPHMVNAATVLVLQSMTSYPRVSLLMPTQPGSLDVTGLARLSDLRVSAAHRLGAPWERHSQVDMWLPAAVRMGRGQPSRPPRP